MKPLAAKSRKLKNMKIKLIGGSEPCYDVDGSADLYGSGWVMIRNRGNVDVDKYLPHPSSRIPADILEHYKKYNTPRLASSDFYSTLVPGSRVQAQFSTKWYFAVITDINSHSKSKNNSSVKYTVRYDDSKSKVITAERIRPMAASAKFSVGANVTAMWCGMGDKDGKGRAAEVLVDSMNQWSNGTVLKVLEDDFGNNLYEIRFRKPDGSEEDDVYTLYGEYILPITS